MSESPILATIPRGIRLSIGPLEFEVPELLADRWLETILCEGASWQGILFQVMPPQAVAPLADLLSSGDVEVRQVVEASQQMLVMASGRTWWETLNVVGVATEAWEGIGGELALRGIIPDQVPFGVWLDATWLLLRRGARQESQSAYDSFVADMKRRPLGVEDDSDGEMDFSDFMRAAGELRGGLPS